MNLKTQKGITMVALIITIILMIILVGVSWRFGTNALDKAKLEDIKTDMLSIKTKAEVIADKYNFKEINELVGSTITEEEAQKIGLTNNDNIRKWSSEDLSNQGLSTIDGDKYIVSYNLEDPNNCEIYFLEGYKGEYSLTDLQD